MEYRIVADVGGTNFRVALVSEKFDRVHIEDVHIENCRNYPTIGAALKSYITKLNAPVQSVCIAMAGPVQGDQLSMSNNDWTFSRSALKIELAVDNLYVINDFTAVAWSLPELRGEQVIQIGSGEIQEQSNVAVFGPGTGLGVEHLTRTSQGWQTLDGEGGHVDFAPVDEDDVIVWRYLQAQHGRASAEEVMSGRGIENIYIAHCLAQGVKPELADAAAITEAAQTKSCAIATKTLHQFFAIMGSFAGNLALNLATYGGVYIGGGITSRFIDELQNSAFRQRFEAKGQLADYVKPIPTFVINEPLHGLIGAGAYLIQQLRNQNHA